MQDYSLLNCVFKEVDKRFQIESSINNRELSSGSIGLKEVKDFLETWEPKVHGRIISYNSKNYTKYDRSLDKKDVELGNYLVRALLPSEKIKQLKLILSPQETLIISINTNNDIISDLPWEACAHANWPKLLEIEYQPKVIVIRSSHIHNVKWNIEEPVKFFIAGSSPKNSPIANFDQECRVIVDCLKGTFQDKSQRKFKIHDENGINFIKLKKAVKDVKPHVLHIVGHGGRGLLQIEDKHGEAAYINDRELYDVIYAAQENICLVFISACLTMRSDKRKFLFCYRFLRICS